MKRIGEVLPKLPPRPAPGDKGAVRISTREVIKCPICQDAGWLREDVPFGHPSFGTIVMCVCKQAEVKERKAEEHQSRSNLDVFAKHHFDDFDPDVPGVGDAFDAALEFAQEPVHGWLFLFGPCGTGKTHLAVAIAKQAREHQHIVYFDVVPDLLDHLRATFDPSSGTAYDDRFSMIRSVDLLVLDDLGTENATPWAREKLYQIINHRYMEQLPTVITSNVDQNKVDERIMSRIRDSRLTKYVDINAEDYRRPGDPRRMRSGGRRR